MIWFLISCAGIAYLLRQDKGLSLLRLLTLVIVVAFTGLYSDRSDLHETRWSPYYAVDLDKANGNITVNNIGHQRMVPFSAGGSSYSLIHLLQRQSGGPPFKDVMIIGAGSGNDIAHALRFTVSKTRRAYVPPASHWASEAHDDNLPPMGMRVRLKADYDISGFAPEVQAILRALKTYGMILADNGSDNFISGAPHPRWNIDTLRQLLRVKTSDLEVLEMKDMVVDPRRK